MSLFGGGGGSKTTYVPTPAPATPTITDKATTAMTDAQYKAFMKTNPSSYSTAILGGAKAAPYNGRR